jgi:Transposase IS116/IS110/IS902 family/Transposase
VKTDAVDARTLAHLLRADLLPEAYVAPPELRELRELLRCHIGLTRLRTALKNRVHALLARQGVQHGRAELFGPRGRRFLGELSLPEPIRRRLESLLALIADFDRELAAVKREIQACAKDEPSVSVLTQIPGVGVFIALLVLAEVGDVSRFPSARHLASWARLTPRVRNSPGAQRPKRRRSPLARVSRPRRGRTSPLGELFESTRVLLLAYLAVRPGERGRGIGTGVVQLVAPDLVLRPSGRPRRRFTCTTPASGRTTPPRRRYSSTTASADECSPSRLCSRRSVRPGAFEASCCSSSTPTRA